MVELEFGDVCSVLWKENWSDREKPSEQDENQQQTQPTYDTEPESNPVVRRTLSPLCHSYSSRLTYDAHTADNHKAQTIAISWGNALRGALILYNISHFLFTCQGFSVVSAVKK